MEAKFTITSREDLVYEAIKEKILKGELKPNQTLNQSEIAHTYGVSIIPVRTAISRLVTEGLLVQDPYHSPQVPALSKDELQEVLLISKNLEILATRQAIPHIGPQALEELHQILSRMQAALDEGELLEYGYINRDFHMAIYRNAGLARLERMIGDLWNQADINSYRAMFDLVPDMADHAQAQHVQLLELIEAKDVEAAAELMAAHKEYSRQAFLIAFDNLNDS